VTQDNVIKLAQPGLLNEGNRRPDRSVLRRRELAKISMPPGALGEPRDPGGTLRFERARRVGPFPLQRNVLGQAVLQIDRAAIGKQRHLRESRDLVRHVLGGTSRVPVGHDPFAQADAQTFFSIHFAAGHDQL
jgi:hypothetical protein